MPGSECNSDVVRAAGSAALLAERFSIPEPNTGCWLWLGATTEGYASFGSGRLHRRVLAEQVGSYGVDRKVIRKIRDGENWLHARLPADWYDDPAAALESGLAVPEDEAFPWDHEERKRRHFDAQTAQLSPARKEGRKHFNRATGQIRRQPMSPRQEWERWQREGRPTLGSRKPLAEYLHDKAQWHAVGAFVSEAKGQPIPAQAVEVLTATVSDLAQLVRERRAAGVEVSVYRAPRGARW